MESENETHGSEKSSIAATWVDWRNISWKLGDSTGLSGVTIEHNSLQKKLGNNIINFWLAKIKTAGHRHWFLQKFSGR